jgi:hypothetical protein
MRHTRHPRHRCAPGFAALPLTQQIELVVGPGMGSAFRDESERHRAWERHRAELLAREQPGKRPWAWWFYDSGVHPGRGH